MNESPIDAKLAGTPSQWREAQEKVATLSVRQRQVMNLMAYGLANRDIGEKMGISIRTVEIHRLHAFRKLEARSTAEAVRLAIYAALAQSIIEGWAPSLPNQVSFSFSK